MVEVVAVEHILATVGAKPACGAAHEHAAVLNMGPGLLVDCTAEITVYFAHLRAAPTYNIHNIGSLN